MRFSLRIALPAALAAGAFFVSAGPASALPSCPDGFVLVPAAFSAKNQDHNGDQLVCVKGPQGSNGHFNTTDDKGNLAPGVEFDPVTNTYLQDSTGYAYWATGSVWYDITTAQDDLGG